MYYADWNYWKRIPQIDLWSAVKLSFGIDPRDEDSIPLAKRKPCKDSKTMPEDLFKERHELARSNLYHGLDASPPDSGQDYGFSKVSLPKFATWALLIELEIPKEFAAMAGPKNATQIYDSSANLNNPFTTIFDETSPTYPPELDMALQAWKAVSTTESKGKPKMRIIEWLENNAKIEGNPLSDEAKKRIAVVANWDRKGGATRTD